MFFTRTEKNIILLIAGFLILGFSSKYFAFRKISMFKPGDEGPVTADLSAETLSRDTAAREKNPVSNLHPSSENHISKKEPEKPDSIFPLNLNTATEAQLIHIKGIGPHLAKAIVKYRNSHGPFKEVSHITKVKGIGEKKLKKFSPFLRI